MATDTDSHTIKRWLLRKLTGEISAPEEEQLRRWMEQDERNRELAGRVLARRFLLRAVSDRQREAQRDAWQRLYYRMGYRRSPLTRLRVSRRVAAAAVLCLLLAGSVLYYMNMHEPVMEAGRAQAIIYVPETENLMNGVGRQYARERLPHGEQTEEQIRVSPNLYTRVVVPQGGEYSLRLADGTLICLNAGSSLTLPADFSPENRQINLSGEAYMEVHKDPEHPFSVQTDRVEISVRGTTLNVEAYEDEPEARVTLVEGRVSLFNGRERVELAEGCVATAGHDRELRIAPADIYETTAWHRRRLVFEDRPLEYIMRRLGRWYGFEASFASDRLRQMRVTIDVDRHDTFNQLARQLEKMNELEIRIRRGRVLVSEHAAE